MSAGERAAKYAGQQIERGMVRVSVWVPAGAAAEVRLVAERARLAHRLEALPGAPGTAREPKRGPPPPSPPLKAPGGPPPARNRPVEALASPPSPPAKPTLPQLAPGEVSSTDMVSLVVGAFRVLGDWGKAENHLASEAVRLGIRGFSRSMRKRVVGQARQVR